MSRPRPVDLRRHRPGWYGDELEFREARLPEGPARTMLRRLVDALFDAEDGELPNDRALLVPLAGVTAEEFDRHWPLVRGHLIFGAREETFRSRLASRAREEAQRRAEVARLVAALGGLTTSLGNWFHRSPRLVPDVKGREEFRWWLEVLRERARKLIFARGELAQATGSEVVMPPQLARFLNAFDGVLPSLEECRALVGARLRAVARAMGLGAAEVGKVVSGDAFRELIRRARFGALSRTALRAAILGRLVAWQWPGWVDDEALPISTPSGGPLGGPGIAAGGLRG